MLKAFPFILNYRRKKKLLFDLHQLLLYTQHSDVGAKSRSFFTLFDNLSSSAAASVLIDILSGVIPSVPFERFKIGVLVRLFGPPGVVPDFL